MKRVICWESEDGVLHRTKELCAAADAEIVLSKTITECTANGIFMQEEFMQVIKTDAVTRKAISHMFTSKTDTVEEMPIQEIED